MTTCIFVSASSCVEGCFECFKVGRVGVGSRVGGSSCKRVDEACLDVTERDRGGGIGFVVALLSLDRDDGGRRVAIGIGNNRQGLKSTETRFARRAMQRSTKPAINITWWRLYSSHRHGQAKKVIQETSSC